MKKPETVYGTDIKTTLENALFSISSFDNWEVR
jgi:hypothetical protein